MKKILLVALAAITLASCAKNEVVELNEGNAISFRAWTSNAGRVAPTTTLSIKDFTVWAYTENDKLYMDAIKVSGGAGAWDYAPHKFWPADKLNFYSVSPTTGGASLVEDTSTAVVVKNFVVAANAASQIDLLYAVNLDEVRKTTAVQVAFDHALAQVSFKASNSNAAAQGIEVVISGVDVAGVDGTGDFILPIGTNTNATDKTATAVQGDWTPSVPAQFTAGMAAAKYTVTDTAEELTNAAGRLLLLPQTKAAWTPAAAYDVADGACFLVNCTVKDLTSNLYLWGAADAPKQLAIPFDADWDPGKHYIYTFQFGEGAGFDPTTGEPVLALIKFDVTVDTFADGAAAGVDPL